MIEVFGTKAMLSWNEIIKTPKTTFNVLLLLNGDHNCYHVAVSSKKYFQFFKYISTTRAVNQHIKHLRSSSLCDGWNFENTSPNLM